MAISLRASGTATTATAAVTAINPAVPTGATTGDLSILTVVLKPNTATITTPSGWTKIGEHTGGATTPVKVAMYYRESASVGAIGNITLGNSPSAAGAVINTYAKGAGEVWDVSSFTTAADASAGTNFSANGAANLNLTTGDWAVVGIAAILATGTWTVATTGGLSATGATMGTAVTHAIRQITTGNDVTLISAYRPVNSGTSTAVPTITASNATSNNGGAAMALRLRASAPKPKIETLVDDFSVDNRATKWPEAYGSTSVTGGTGRVTAVGATDYAGLQSLSAGYDLTESYAKVKMTPATGIFSALTITPVPAAGDDLSMLWSGGTLTLGIRTAYGHAAQAGSVAVPAGTSIYMGVGEGVAGAAAFGATGTAGNLYFYTSTDGSTWTQRRTVASPAYIGALTVLLEAGEGSATAVFDDFNVNTAPPNDFTGTASLTGSGTLTATGVVKSLSDSVPLTGSGTLTAYGYDTANPTVPGDIHIRVPISYVRGNTSISIDTPANAQIGDLLVYTYNTSDTVTSNSATPTALGFTSLGAGGSATFGTMRMAWKPVTVDDIGKTWTFADPIISDTNDGVVQLFAIAGADTVTPTGQNEALSYTGSASATQMIFPIKTATEDKSLAMFVAGYWNATSGVTYGARSSALAGHQTLSSTSAGSPATFLGSEFIPTKNTTPPNRVIQVSPASVFLVNTTIFDPSDVPLETPSTTKRFYDTTATLAAIDAATSVAEINQALDTMEAAYGLSLLGITNTTTTGTRDWTVPTIDNPKLKVAVKEAVDCLATYPPDFIKRAGLTVITFCSNITTTGGTSGNIGGFATITQLFLDIEDYSTDPTKLGMRYIFHHEIQHVFGNIFSAQREYLTAEWTALNPAGFTYNTDYANPPYAGDWPQGFVRDYARHSFYEDLAETAGIIFDTKRQALLANMVATDPIIAAKVALIKQWMADRTRQKMSGTAFYTAIHSGLEYTGSASLSGSGTLAASGAMQIAGFRNLTGSGTLTASGNASVTRSVALSGAGTLTSAQTPGLTRTGALTGSGTLTGTATGISASRSASLTGSGTLTATGSPSYAASVSLTGSGLLDDTVTGLSVLRTVPLTGSGTLTAVAVGMSHSRTAAFTGSGTLGFQTTISGATSAALAGSGILSATGDVRSLSGSASFTGSGTLSSTRTVATSGNAALTGSGTLTASGVGVITANVALTGSGTLTTQVGAVSRTGAGALTGSGTLTVAVGAVSRTGAASFSGSGTLTAPVAGLSVSRTAALTGDGALGVQTAVSGSATVFLSGTGNLKRGSSFFDAFNGVTSPFNVGNGTEYDSIDSGELLHLPVGAAHRVRYRNAETFSAGSTISARVKLTQTTPKLAGISFVDADNTGQLYGVIIDTRNGSGSTSGFQIREGTGTITLTGVTPSQPVLADTWYRITANIGTDGVITASLFLDDGTLIATASRTPTVYSISSFYPGVYGYGENRTDDYSVESSVAVPNLTANGALDGSGTLTAVSTGVSQSRTANLTGSGTLSRSVTVNLSRSAALSGSGTLTPQTTPRVSVGVSLSGSGSLALSATGVALSGAANLTGSGTLGSVATGMGHTASVGLSGAGSLTPETSTAGAASAALSGSGTLSVSVGNVSRIVTVNLTGSGTLGGLATLVTASRSAALSGSGTLSSTGTSNVVSSATFTGSGTLSAAVGTVGRTGTAVFGGSGTLSSTITGLNIARTVATSGSGTLNALATGMSHTADVDFSGEGDLGYQTAVSGAANATLDGTGTLSVTTVTSILRSAGLTGSGTLTSTRTLGTSTSASLSGSGTLSVSRIPSVAVSVNTSGSGTLARSVTPAFSRNVALSGSGTLSVSVATSVPVVVNFSGTGLLGPDVTLVTQTETADFSGTGSLNPQTATSGSASAFLAGSGDLDASATLSAEGDADFGGTGTLSATSTVFASRTATLSGSGTLSAAGKPAFARTANLSGSGTLSRSVQIGVTGTAQLSGSGDLNTTGASERTGNAALTGSGTLTASTKMSVTAVASLDGTGSLGVNSATSGTGFMFASGEGFLSVATETLVKKSAGLSGSGTLTVATKVSTSGSAAFSGSGNLTASIRTDSSDSVALTGSGSLSATGKPSSAVEANFGGESALTVATGAAVNAVVNLIGEGELEAVATLQATGIAAFTGSGLLDILTASDRSDLVDFTGEGILSVVTRYIPPFDPTPNLEELEGVLLPPDRGGVIEPSPYGTTIERASYDGVILDTNYERFNGKLVEDIIWWFDILDREL